MPSTGISAEGSPNDRTIASDAIAQGLSRGATLSATGSQPSAEVAPVIKNVPRDFLKYKEGDIVDSFGNKIEHLISKSTEYLVYLDYNLGVWWCGNAIPFEFGETTVQVAALESIDISY